MFPQMVRFFRVRPRLRPELYCGAPVAGPDAPQPHGSGLRPVPQPFSGRFSDGVFPQKACCTAGKTQDRQ